MRAASREINLTEGPIAKQLALFALPILFGSLFQQMYNVADAVIVGWFVGKEALAAVDASASLIRLFINLFVGISSGASIVVSQHLGAKREDGVSHATHTATAFALVSGALLTVAGLLAAPACLRAMDIPEEIYAGSLIYIRIYFCGMIPSMIYNMGSGILRAVGDSRRPFYFLAATCFLNIALDLLFVAGFRWGVAGVGIATVLSQLFSAALVTLSLTRTSLPCRLEPRRIGFRRDSLIQVLQVGLPIGLQSTMFPISNILVQANINRFGTDAVAAWAVVGKLDFLVWTISDVFGIAISTFSAQNFGAGNLGRIHRGVKVSMAMVCGIILCISITLLLWCEPLGRLFVNDDAVITNVRTIINIMTPLAVVFTCSDIFSGAVRGTGQTLHPMILTMSGICVARIIWLLTAVPLRPMLSTVILGYPISWVITSAAYFTYYQVFRKKHLA